MPNGVPESTLLTLCACTQQRSLWRTNSSGCLPVSAKSSHSCGTLWCDYKAAKTRPAAETRRTAIYEAGHVVVLIALGLAFVGVSIIPDIRAGTLDQVFCSQEMLRPILTLAKRPPRAI